MMDWVGLQLIPVSHEEQEATFGAPGLTTRSKSGVGIKTCSMLPRVGRCRPGAVIGGGSTEGPMYGLTRKKTWGDMGDVEC